MSYLPTKLLYSRASVLLAASAPSRCRPAAAAQPAVAFLIKKFTTCLFISIFQLLSAVNNIMSYYFRSWKVDKLIPLSKQMKSAIPILPHAPVIYDENVGSYKFVL